MDASGKGAAGFEGKLFVQTIDARDENEEKYMRAYRAFEETTAGLSDKDFHDLLSSLVSKEKQHEEISLALVYIILTDPSSAPKTYRDLTLLTRDGLGFVTANLAMLVAEKYHKLTDVGRKQLLWLLRELIKNQVLNVDNLAWNILRQASGGDISPKNVALIEGLLDIFTEHRAWLEKDQFLVGTVAYTFVRLIEDHFGPQFVHLRNREVKFVISLIRDRFMDIIPLGREFVRLLQNVGRIPEFDQLWKDMLYNPKSLCPTFNGVWQLLQTRTSRRFLRGRLTPDIERKIHFLTSNVKFGNQKRYQDWFQERYFNTPESQSLRCDLIRFIISAIHPTNDMLCSDIIPRWAIIGWLLTSCTNAVTLANAKLALFYDWLFFDPAKDNIMNVEPGILVMYHSIKNHPLVSCTLLDFLCRIMKNFYPKWEDRIRTGIYNSLRKILEMKVIPNLVPLFESPKLDRELKGMLRETFREFCVPPNSMYMHPGPPQPGMETPMMMHYPGPGGGEQVEQHPPHLMHPAAKAASTAASADDPKFSDDEDDATTKPATTTTTTTTTTKTEDVSDDDDLPLAKVRLLEKPAIAKVALPDTLNGHLEEFLREKSVKTFEPLLQCLGSCGKAALNQEQENYLTESVISVIKQTLPDKSYFPASKTDDNLSESINYPLFAAYRLLYQQEDSCKKRVMALLVAIVTRVSVAGYMLLYFLKVHGKLQGRRKETAGGSTAFKASVYGVLCDALDSVDSVDECIEKDLNLLEKHNTQMFLWILPDMYREFKQTMLNNTTVLRLLVGCIDANNLGDIIYSITQGKLILFDEDGIVEILRKSLEYETFEQVCIWQLVQAHDIPLETFQEIIPELESGAHAEALTAILLLLRAEKPTTELVRLLLSRETESKHRGDPFVTSVLRYWCQEFEEKLSELIAALLTSKYPSNSPNKRKRPSKSAQQNTAPTSEQLLNHLEHFRRSCRHGNGTGTGLFVQNDMQRALQQAFTHSSESQRKQFSDLFALAAEDETSTTVGRRGTSSRGRKAPSNKKETAAEKAAAAAAAAHANNSKKAAEASAKFSDDSSDEDWSKQKASKRRKTLSDSD
ncbi:AGAP002539-PA [Anopheles gambiae str. PEST]|uniref:Integrator complex subunit 3 homolog n=1 Tax=Anopheles gambiae TaxID=7165 RepID=INT3_ANOGA|nr:RecName: Full=Integrator complex subunit 3 homolog; AltName: Full=SOSS complex subunit A homolog [Anopheles gambiae]EAA07507.6 AGAP002539-PA [Anopheles gambiae str. PEST]